MRVRLTGLVVGLLLLSAAGCGTRANTAPATPEEEKAAEQRIRDEAARELKARKAEKANPQAPPDD